MKPQNCFVISGYLVNDDTFNFMTNQLLENSKIFYYYFFLYYLFCIKCKTSVFLFILSLQAYLL
jgi:hypothetical protein